MANIMCRRFPTYDRSLRGYMKGWPMECLYEYAAIVGSLASNRMIAPSAWVSSGEVFSG